MSIAVGAEVALNGICPYFTMFPLEFPLGILRRLAGEGDLVLDPFCGRGTTNFAARLLGLTSLGVDCSPVAVAITAAKLVTASVEDILDEARTILIEGEADWVPATEFWRWAYHPVVLLSLCKLREAFLKDCSTAPRIALRGIVLGALHGPKQKTSPGYFSNQCPRTYAPKPAYAVRFWRSRGLAPDLVDVLSVIERRARRYYGVPLRGGGVARLADSRVPEALQPQALAAPFSWVITSPPYYGMRTYLPDQWLRNWFVGGPESVDYSNRDQITHSSPQDYVSDLQKVWCNAARVSGKGATMVIRFGGIRDRRADPLDLITRSLNETGWRVKMINQAGSANQGKRQADAFLREKTDPMVEFDIWAERSDLTNG